METPVLLLGLLDVGDAGALWRAVRDRRAILVTANDQLTELAAAWSQAALAPYVHREDGRHVVEEVRTRAHVTELVPPVPKWATRDVTRVPKEFAPLFALAYWNVASWIVTARDDALPDGRGRSGLEAGPPGAVLRWLTEIGR